MNIIVCGVGRFGLLISLGLLDTGEYNVTIIEKDKFLTDLYNELYDLKCIDGSASDYNILSKSNAGAADAIICLMCNNETNILTCQMAHSLFSVPKKIARLSNDFYKTCHSFIHAQKAFAIDSVFVPEKVMVEAINNSIIAAGTDEVFSLLNNNVYLIKINVKDDAPIIGIEISRINKIFPEVNFKIILIKKISSNQEEIIINKLSDYKIELGDCVYILLLNNQLNEVMKLFGYVTLNISKTVIATSGQIGVLLVEKLLNNNHDMELVFISSSEEDAIFFNSYFPNLDVVLGDFNHVSVLNAANVYDADLFLAMSDDSNKNIVSALSAKSLGCKQVFSLIQDNFYQNIKDLTNVDAFINPQSHLISNILNSIYNNFVNICPLHKKSHYVAELIINHNLAGLSCKDLSFKFEISIIGCLQKNIAYFDEIDDLILKINDRIIICGTIKMLGNLDKKLTNIQ